MESGPYARSHLPSRMPSMTMMRVPKMVRMISGRNRVSSAALGAKLAGTGHFLRKWGDRATGGRGEVDSKWHVDLGLVQNLRRGLTHRRQETLRIHAHLDHHRNQRNHYRPLARIQVDN